MSILLLDIVCLVLMVIGVCMVIKAPAPRDPRGAIAAEGGANADPMTYILRIAGTIIAMFGLALGLMMTLFHVLWA